MWRNEGEQFQSAFNLLFNINGERNAAHQCRKMSSASANSDHTREMQPPTASRPSGSLEYSQDVAARCSV